MIQIFPWHKLTVARSELTQWCCCWWRVVVVDDGDGAEVTQALSQGTVRNENSARRCSVSCATVSVVRVVSTVGPEVRARWSDSWSVRQSGSQAVTWTVSHSVSQSVYQSLRYGTVQSALHTDLFIFLRLFTLSPRALINGSSKILFWP